MTYTVELSKCLDLMRVLSQEVKTKYSVGENEISTPYIQKEYGLKIKYANVLSKSKKIPAPTVTFPSESHYMLLMMKYYEKTHEYTTLATRHVR
jgi:hypothetical protein